MTKRWPSAVVMFAVFALFAWPATGQETQPAPAPPAAEAPAAESPAAPAAESPAAPAAEVPAAPAAEVPARTGPDTVKVGAYINDIQQLDLQSHSYNVDLYMWFKWSNPDINPVASLEFMNSFELWGHILTKETEEPVKMPDGTLYQALRNQGKFNTKLPLEKYPFDKQLLVVEIENSSADASEMVFVPDDDPIASNPDMTLPGYALGAPRLKVIEKSYATNFGTGEAGVRPPYSRVTIELPVNRPAFTYAIKLFLPMLLVVLSAMFMFLINPIYVEGRIAIGITALLALVALQITLNNDLPEVDYLMLMDKVYLASYAFVVAGLGCIVRDSWINVSDAAGVAETEADDRINFTWLALAYAVAMALVFASTFTTPG